MLLRRKIVYKMMASIPPHHVKNEVCTTRPMYREGREPKAVKVYTVSSESKYLLIRGVPINRGEDLAPIFSIHGEIDELHGLGDYPEKEEFTEVFLIKYKNIQSARFAKRKLDDLSFFGGCLHVCYAPEYETLAETRAKLVQRRRIIAIKTSKSKALGEDSQDTGDPILVSQVPTAHQTDPVLASRTESTDFHPSSSDVLILPNLSLPPPPIPPLPPPQLITPLPPPPPPQLITPLPPPPPQEVFSSMLTLPPPPPQEPPEQYSLLSPPKHLPIELQTPKVKTKFEYAKVMSAQAMFPVGFDARLPSQQLSTDNQQVSALNKASNSLKRNQPNAEIIGEPKATLAIDNQANTKNNGKTDLVIREVKKKLSVPKFIPRQAMNRVNQHPQGEDKLDKALRATAVQLGEMQGPKCPEELQPVSKELQASLDETRQTIRKRVSQLSDTDKEVVAKKISKMV